MALPSVGFADKQTANTWVSQWIISQGKTLIQSFDNKKRTAYFVKWCWEGSTGAECSHEKRNGIWFCSVNDEGTAVCKRDQ